MTRIFDENTWRPLAIRGFGLGGEGSQNLFHKCAERNENNLRTQNVYYESTKREPKKRGIYQCRCDERLQTKSKEFTRLAYTGLVLELEHLKIETRLINESFANAMGECEN